jgi:hypothetical protein
MNDTKAAITSVGFWGPLIASVVVLAKLAGYDISENVVGLDVLIAQTVDNLVILGGALAGIYGRWTAKKQITGLVVAK